MSSPFRPDFVRVEGHDAAPALLEPAASFVILGGIHASLRPEEALQHVDCIVTGEAEALWPHVVRDLEAGKLKSRYDAVGYPPMDAVPVPAWRAVDTSQYLFHQLPDYARLSRSACRFCNVPDISGQDFRFKAGGVRGE